MPNYFLDPQYYTWSNALCHGYAFLHLKQAQQGHLGQRVFHLLTGLVETDPLWGQILSIFEKFLFFLSIEIIRKDEEERRVFHEKIEGMKKKADPKTMANHLVTNLMMDKLFIPEEEHQGSLPVITTKYVHLALQRLVQNENSWVMDEECRHCLKVLQEKLIPLLEKHLELFRLEFVSRNEMVYLDEIYASVKKLKVGEAFLIPIGCLRHATDLLVKRTGPSIFCLVHYNTGFGVDKWHHRYQQTHLYQTFDQIDEVPEASVLNEEEWRKHFLGLRKQKEMDFGYDWIRNHIGKGGVIKPASVHEEEYEAIQNSGACTTQSKMALIRHEVMQIIPGTPAEKEAGYKLIKTYLFLQFLQDHQDTLEEGVKQHLLSILEKLQGEQALIQITLDEQRMLEASEKLKEIFQRLGENPDMASLPAEASFLMRYAHLRKLSLTIFKQGVLNQGKLSDEELSQPLFQFLSAKKSKELCVKKNIAALFKKTAEKKDQSFIDGLFFILVHTPHLTFTLKEGLPYLADELPTANQPPKRTKELLDSLNVQHAENDPLVKQIAEEFANLGKRELSKYVTETWAAHSPQVAPA